MIDPKVLRMAKPGPESLQDVSFIRSKSKTFDPVRQTGPELKDAHWCWPFSNGGHILKLTDELLDISFTSQNRGLEAVPGA